MNLKTKLLVLALLAFQVIAERWPCPIGYICGHGCSMHISEAQADARVDLAKTFQVSVDAKFTSIESSFGKFDEASYKDSVKEVVSENLQGVETIKEYKDSENYSCVLMGLNKQRFITRNRDDVSKLVNESKKLLASGKNLVLSKVRENNLKIAKHDLYLATLTDGYKSNQIKNLKVKRKYVSLIIVAEKELSTIRNLLISEMNKNEVYQGESSTTLKIDLKLKQEHINVEGFIKKSLEVNMNNANINVSRVITKTGRNIEDLLNQYKAELKTLYADMFIDIKI